MNVGVPCNICEFNRDTHAVIISFNPDGSGRRLEAKGIRNSVGFDWHPQTRELWATNNGRDWAGNETPQDTLHRVRRSGEDHGFPYCAANWRDPAITTGPAACSEFVAPAAMLGPHTAALGMRFYTGTAFPEAYRNQMFIARRGSWNRDQKSGYDVVVAKTDGQGNVTSVEPFMTGLLDEANNRFLGRPVDVLVRRDG
jgi:glucose/arabinose dehydrogenase